MNLLTEILLDGFLAAIAAFGYSAVFRPTLKIMVSSAILAAVGHMTRFLLLEMPLGIVSATLWASVTIAFCSMPLSRHWHIPAEMFIFPALLPMVPGMYAYKTILSILQFLSGPVNQELLANTVYNGLTTFFTMGALVIGANLPLIVFREDAPVGRLLLRLMGSRARKLLHHRSRP